MAMKTSDWRPGPTVCRCCLNEGCYKDISTEYFWMGKREVYAEMLSDTLSLTIGYAKSGPNSNSRLICEACISRLRDAHDFRRQVQECEKTFMNYIDPGSNIDVDLEEIKVENVKQEKKNSDDEDFDDRVDFEVNNDSDDDLDDEPLMKLATKVPKKEKEVDLLDLLDNTQITVKRKSTPSTSKSKEPATKKSKKIVIKTAGKAKASSSKTEEKKKKEQVVNRVVSVERSNARAIVENTTVYPFKMPRSNMSCIYCDEEFEEPHLFREHMKENHDKTTSGRGRLYDGAPRLVKVDCTEASCRICSQTFDDLHCMAEHLKSKHGLDIDLDSCLGVIPFALHNRQWSCVYCNLRAATLRVLSKHMTMVHFAVITCEECGKSFANARSLVLHVERHHRKVIRCRKCRELFHTIDERLTHYKANPSCWPSVCHLCNMRFMSDIPKEKHMQEVHNIFSKNLTCTECDQTFPNTRECVKHFRIAHTDDKLCCAFCPKMFVSKARLVRHTVSHTKEKPFTCMECGKGFGSQSSLNQHVWIHREVKRFKCLPCNKQFNQKITWMAHMRSIHPTSEVVRKSLLKQAERENTEKVE